MPIAATPTPRLKTETYHVVWVWKDKPENIYWDQVEASHVELAITKVRRLLSAEYANTQNIRILSASVA